MFTGIIEELGIFKALTRAGSGARLTLSSKVCVSDARKGDSISVNGACLTIIDIRGESITFDVSDETLSRANLGALKAGDFLNMERALRADSRLGGHFVTGHIDCMGRIISKKVRSGFFDIEIEIEPAFIRYVVNKGSIAVDGISLTVNKVKANSLILTIIPHTIASTNLRYKRSGDSLNIEFDILAKYVESLFCKPNEENPAHKAMLTKELLSKHGFM